MKKKLLIGGGLVALVAVIVAIAVFGKGGDYFKGSIDQIREQFNLDNDVNNVVTEPQLGEAVMLETTTGPDFYVASNYGTTTCNATNPTGSKKCPFKKIQDAFDVLGGITNATIYVAEGSYDSFDYDGHGANRSLKGGYNNAFTSQGLTSKIKGKATLSKIKGEVSGFKFEIQDGISYGLKVLNDDQAMDIYNNVFVGGFTTGNSVILSGKNVVFRDNYFTNAQSDKSLVYASGLSTVKNNNFYQSVAGGNTDGIINVSGAYAYNNLISHSLSETSNAISASGSSIVANNTISDNSELTNVALNIQATSKAYNNLVVNSGGGAIALGEFALASNNGVGRGEYGPSIKTEYLQNGTGFFCDPKFVSVRGYDMNNYKLGKDSDCVNKGVVVSQVTKDAFGTSRPQGSAYDVGFYESPLQFVQQLKPIDPIVIATCGNNIRETGETCDDGNKTNGDGCSSTCLIEISPRPTDFCGNGLVNTSTEECDDSNQTSGDGCSSTCKIEEDDTPPVTPPTECGEWSDVSESDSEYDIWMYLCEKGIVLGNADGTLRPEDVTNRAEILALAFRASDEQNVYSVDSNAKDCFPDVNTEWYAKYFCTAKNKGFIEGYQDGKAKPERKVILAEGLKMFLGALDEPLELDLSDTNCWYCNMVEEAGYNDYLPYSFTDPKQVGPIELTRRKAFNMLYRIMIYR